jgi:hypothetical protein
LSFENFRNQGTYTSGFFESFSESKGSLLFFIIFSKDQWFMVGPLTVLSVLRTMVRSRTRVGGAIQKMAGYQQRGPRVGFS